MSVELTYYISLGLMLPKERRSNMPDILSSGLNKLSPSRVAEAIRAMRHTGISLYVHGGPGISKSSVALQTANEAGIAFIDVRLSQRAPEDIRGVPTVGEIDHMKGMIWFPPLEFPRDLDYEGIDTVENGSRLYRFFNPVGDNGIHYCTDPKIEVACLQDFSVEVNKSLNGFSVTLRDADGKIIEQPAQIQWKVTGETKAILALEEFNSAAPSVMAASYQLVLDRRLGDYIVPKGVMILAMGNRSGDRGVTFDLPKPVANRFIHIEMEFNWDDWFSWAVKANIHPDVLGFLSKWPAKTNCFDPDSPSPSFRTPRSWAFVSKLISQNPLPSAETLRALIAGALGDDGGAEFVQHRKFMAEMPNVSGILDGSVTKFSAKREFEIQIAYSVCVQMCHELRDRANKIERDYRGSPADFNRHPARRQWLIEADRGFGYAIDNFRPDVTIMAARMCTINHKLKFSSTHMPRFAEFCDQYREVLMS
jgi:MoxR-like ATPase